MFADLVFWPYFIHCGKRLKDSNLFLKILRIFDVKHLVLGYSSVVDLLSRKAGEWIFRDTAANKLVLKAERKAFTSALSVSMVYREHNMGQAPYPKNYNLIFGKY